MEKRKRGRPPIREGERKTRTVPFRCEEWLYRAMFDAAKGNGRTASQEIAARLTQSFVPPAPTVQAIEAIAKTIMGEPRPGKSVLETIKNLLERASDVSSADPTSGDEKAIATTMRGALLDAGKNPTKKQEDSE